MKKVILILAVAILLTGCASSLNWRVYDYGDGKSDKELGNTLVVCKIYHNYYKNDYKKKDFRKRKIIEFHFVINDKPHQTQTFFYSSYPVEVVSYYSNYMFISFNGDITNKFIYLDKVEDPARDIYGSFTSFKNNPIIEYTPGTINFLGTYVIYFDSGKYSLQYLKPTPKENLIVLNEVIKEFKHTKFEQMVWQKLGELKEK